MHRYQVVRNSGLPWRARSLDIHRSWFLTSRTRTWTSAGEQALTDTLQRAKAKGITVVVITQRPAVLKAMDKLLILRGGRMEAFGPPSENLLRIVRPADAKQPETGGEKEKSIVSGPRA